MTNEERKKKAGEEMRKIRHMAYEHSEQSMRKDENENRERLAVWLVAFLVLAATIAAAVFLAS